MIVVCEIDSANSEKQFNEMCFIQKHEIYFSNFVFYRLNIWVIINFHTEAAQPDIIDEFVFYGGRYGQRPLINKGVCQQMWKIK